MKDVNKKRQFEKEMVSLMIQVYCRGHHGTGKKGLCPECAALEAYAHMRSDRCPFMETKTFCSNCKVHCYKPCMRQKIQAVMRYSGPRMLLYHPITTIRHVIVDFQEKKKQASAPAFSLKKMFFVLLGCLSLAAGAAGAILPLLPAFPFLLLAAFCFGKSSSRLHTWFLSTRLYKDNLESFVEKRGMTRKTKIRVMITITLLMLIGFAMMHQIVLGQILLTCIWIFHILYFCFGIQTLPAAE